MTDYIYLIKDLIKCKGNFNQFLRNRLGSSCFKDLSIIELKNLSHIVSDDGTKYYPDQRLSGAISGGKEYNISDVKETDIVLDIGGFLGTFAIPISKKCKRVYVIEPIFTDEILANIELNAASNITLLPYAISDKHEQKELEYWEKYKIVQFMPFSEILDMIPESIDFVKIDIEGAEWWIKPEEIQRINARRIELEMHQNITTNDPAALIDFISEKYDCNKTPWKPNDKRTGFLSAKKI